MGETELRDMLLSLPEYGIPGKYEALAVLFCGFDAMSQERMPKRNRWRKSLVVSVSAVAAAAAAVVLFFAARIILFFLLHSFQNFWTTRGRILS